MERFVSELFPKAMSESCVRFLEHLFGTQHFVYFVTELVTRSDAGRKRAIEALLFMAPEDERERLKKSRAQGNVHQKELVRYRQVILEILITRTVDNYLVFISELLATVFRTRPEMLRSNERVPLEFVLRYDNMDDLVDALAERRVERLAYSGMRQRTEDLGRTIGFELFESESDQRRVVKLVEDRNLLVHNRGVVTRTYLSRVGEHRALGSRLDLDANTVFEDVEFLAQTAVLTDERAATKWQLPVAIYPDSSSLARAQAPT
jgi:hypothetical protein